MMTAIILTSYMLIILILIALAYRDNEEFILPDVLNLALLLAFISFHISTEWAIITPVEALLGALIVGALLLTIRTIANGIYKKDTLGLGDIKLMTAAGFGIGYPTIFLTLIIGSLLGIIHGFYIMYMYNKTAKEKVSLNQVKVPAGVGLAAAILITIIWKFGYPWVQK